MPFILHSGTAYRKSWRVEIMPLSIRCQYVFNRGPACVNRPVKVREYADFLWRGYSISPVGNVLQPCLISFDWTCVTGLLIESQMSMLLRSFLVSFIVLEPCVCRGVTSKIPNYQPLVKMYQKSTLQIVDDELLSVWLSAFPFSFFFFFLFFGGVT